MRYWRIDTIKGKGKSAQRRRLCTVASNTAKNPIKLARANGFKGPISAKEMTAEEYALDINGQLFID